MLHRHFMVALAAAVAVGGCENDPSIGVEGTYPIVLTYNEDTCANDGGRSEAFELTIEREGDNVTLILSMAGTLTGTFDNESRIMTVQGPILAQNPEGGTYPGQMHMLARVTEGEVNASGRIDFEGTFPGVPGTCSRHFLASGERRNLSPLPLTGS